MLNTKDVAGFLNPLAQVAQVLHAVTIPGETATLSTAETASMARSSGLVGREAENPQAAVQEIIKDQPNARIVICGSLYLAGVILRENS